MYESEVRRVRFRFQSNTEQRQLTDNGNKVERMGVEVVFGSQSGEKEALLESTIRETFIDTDTPSCKNITSGKAVFRRERTTHHRRIGSRAQHRQPELPLRPVGSFDRFLPTRGALRLEEKAGRCPPELPNPKQMPYQLACRRADLKEDRQLLRMHEQWRNRGGEPITVQIVSL